MTPARTWRNRVADVARALAYLWIAWAGASVLYQPPSSYDVVSGYLTIGWGVLQLAAVVAAVAVLARRPMLEWSILTIFGVGVGLYAVLSWQAVGREGVGHMPRASDITALVFLVVSRFFDQWQRVEQAKTIVRAREEHE